MTSYMVSITMPDHKDGEFLSLIPAQRQHVDRLMEKGVISSYTLSADRTRLWVTLSASSGDEAREITAEFPLRKFMALEVTELTFHHAAAPTLPALSMN